MTRPNHVAETKRIRAAIWARSDGRCESCKDEITEQSGQMDHTRGRVRESQAVRNCWFICPRCHRDRTNNSPSAAWWWWKVGVWAHENGYWTEAEHAQLMIDKQKQKGLAP